MPFRKTYCLIDTCGQNSEAELLALLEQNKLGNVEIWLEEAACYHQHNGISFYVVGKL